MINGRIIIFLIINTNLSNLLEEIIINGFIYLIDDFTKSMTKKNNL